MAKVKTTKADFEFFKSEVLKWIDKFSLHDNEVAIEHKDIGESVGQCAYNFKARISRITLAKSFHLPTDDYSKREYIKETAFHEVAELLLARFDVLAKARYIDPDELEAESHAIIHRLQRLLL